MGMYSRFRIRFLFVCCIFLFADISNTQAEQKSSIAQALFKRHCKNAGERIFERVEDVNGFLLLKIRPQKVNWSDQFVLDDPYGDDLGGDGYIKSFLRANYDLEDASRHLRVGKAKDVKRTREGYEFVEAVDPKDGLIYRYTGFVEQPGLKNPAFSRKYYRVILTPTLATGPNLRYAVTFDDISTRKDREHWIAGSSLKVIDLQEKRVIAERIGYMYDPSQGNTSGGRSPWLMAANHACPAFDGYSPRFNRFGQTVRFVEKVLIPARNTINTVK